MKQDLIFSGGTKIVGQIVEKILAIRWHMGQYDFYARGGGHDLDNAFHQSKLAVMLHLADMMATHFDEREETEE